MILRRRSSALSSLRRLSALFSISAFILPSLFTGQARAQTYIVHAHLVDVETQTIKPDYTVVLLNDTIAAIGPSSTLRPPAGTTVIDATGKWLMPGLVDAHVHFFQTGGLYTRPDAIDLRKYYPYEKEVTWYKQNMERQCRRYLASGITTVIDDGATLALLAQRDTFADKYYTPRILMAGPLLSTGYDPVPFDELRDPDEPFYPVNTPAEAAAMTAKQYPYRPDMINLWYIRCQYHPGRGRQVPDGQSRHCRSPRPSLQGSRSCHTE